ncbi:hypothetical protein C4J81_18725 (plasmid) [Deltaproteobacteria bacterium Smac51]|nr:hypothetical protein C4J81_18725 [Deltaproteobacteria bacterium Smac51]
MKIIEKVSRLENPRGAEIYISLTVAGAASFEDAFKRLKEAYVSAAANLGLDSDSEIWVRFFLSDIQNQHGLIEKEGGSLKFCVGQRPLNSDYAALMAYHIKAEGLVKQASSNGDELTVEHGGYRSVFGNYFPDSAADSEAQTGRIIEKMNAHLERHGARLERDVLRTWYYIRDIDNNYQGMVKMRRVHYEARGLTPQTRFIASTGIEGTAHEPWMLSFMTAMATVGLAPSQTRHLKALHCLSPTHVYGVNFERATLVHFGDRSHIHLSGTASIDKDGQIVHPSDVGRQAERMLHNVENLLNEGAMNCGNMQYIILYLRDATEYKRLAPAFEERFGHQPMAVVEGPVCRPGWLVEIEGLAAALNESGFAPFC